MEEEEEREKVGWFSHPTFPYMIESQSDFQPPSLPFPSRRRSQESNPGLQIGVSCLVCHGLPEERHRIALQSQQAG